MVKILYVINKSTDGGLETTTRSRINAFAKRGIQAEVLFLEKGDGASLFNHIPHYYGKGIEFFHKVINDGNYDAIIFLYYLSYRSFVPVNFKGKIIYELRGWSPGVIKELSKKNINKSVDAVICIAQYIVPLVKKYFPHNTPIFVDKNTVDPIFNYIDSSKRTLAINQPNHPIIAFVGRIEAQKNWREFITICINVNKIIPIELWFLCNPHTSSQLNEMKRECNRNKLNFRVLHVNNEKMPEIYSTIADSGGCVLSTSIREGLGNSILEPMACGCPVVSSNKPGKNEVIHHEGNGMLYKLGFIEKLSNIWRKL